MSSDVYNVDLIRRHVLRYLNHNLRVYISLLSPTEMSALTALHGKDGVKNTAYIADVVLEALGHAAPKVINGDSPTLKAARK